MLCAREDEMHRVASSRGDPGQRVADTIGVRLDEARVVVERTQLQNLGRVGADLDLRPVDVLAVLAATGVRAERRREERECATDAVVAHVPDRLGEIRVPVAVPEVDGQRDPMGGELGFERGDQRAVLPVDRADAAEEVVVMADLGEPLSWDAAPTRDVLEERDHVAGAFRTTERDDDQSIVGAVLELGVGAVRRLLPGRHPSTLARPTGSAAPELTLHIARSIREGTARRRSRCRPGCAR